MPHGAGAFVGGFVGHGVVVGASVVVGEGVVVVQGVVGRAVVTMRQHFLIEHPLGPEHIVSSGPGIEINGRGQ